MAKRNWTKLAAAAIIGLALSALAGMHAASMVTTKSNPGNALAVSGSNAAAREDLAYAAFTAQVNDADDLRDAAQNVRNEALEAYRSDPTSSRALALLAIAMTDAERRHDAVLTASKLNRRDLTLQGLTLEAYLARKNTPMVLETLDQFLRVRPSYSAEFFPLIADAFANPANLTDFVRIFDGSSPWHERFFITYAIHEEELLSNLAVVRASREIGGENFDRQLVSKLAAARKADEAQQLVAAISTDSDAEPGADGALGWTSKYPPLDWSFRDRGNFRAQASLDGTKAELFVRPGQGGIVAERIVSTPTSPFTISFDQDAERANQAENVKLELRCADTRELFFEQELTNGANAIRVTELPTCSQMVIAINARAFRGEPTLRSELGQITIR